MRNICYTKFTELIDILPCASKYGVLNPNTFKTGAYLRIRIADLPAFKPEEGSVSVSGEHPPAEKRVYIPYDGKAGHFKSKRLLRKRKPFLLNE